MKVFVTGTAGFIGYHLAERLLGDGHDVVGFDGFTPYYDVTLKERRHERLCRHQSYTPVVAMLEDGDALLTAVNRQKPDVIIHLAAQAGVRYSLENPAAYVDSNLVGSFKVLEAARAAMPRHLLLASTSSVYGANPSIPFRESDKFDEPLTLYAATKKSMETMAHAYAHLFMIPTTAFRFFTVYGPWGRPDMALFKFVDAAINGRPIDVYGHGQMARDCTSVHDLVEAIVRLIDVAPDEGNRVVAPGVTDTLSPQGPFRVVNIGGGQPVPLTRFVDVIEEALGIPVTRHMLPMQPADVPRTYAAPALLEALTGYVPSTSLETVVREFVDWYRSSNVLPAEPAAERTS